MGYLAQTQLLDQITELANDIDRPIYTFMEVCVVVLCDDEHAIVCDHCILKMRHILFCILFSMTYILLSSHLCTHLILYDRKCVHFILYSLFKLCVSSFVIQQNDDDIYIVNFWFGPKGTVTPLHYDPYHVILGMR